MRRAQTQEMVCLHTPARISHLISILSVQPACLIPNLLVTVILPGELGVSPEQFLYQILPLSDSQFSEKR